MNFKSFIYCSIELLQIIQYQYNNVTVMMIVSMVDRVKWIQLMVQCFAEIVTLDLQDHSVTVSLRLLMFKGNYHTAGNSMNKFTTYNKWFGKIFQL